MVASEPEVTGIAQVPAHHVDELRIALCGPNRSGVPDRPNRSPASQSRRPRPSAAASVPLRIATARGAPPSRIGSVKARCTGTLKPGGRFGCLPSDQRSAAEGEE